MSTSQKQATVDLVVEHTASRQRSDHQAALCCAEKITKDYPHRPEGYLFMAQDLEALGKKQLALSAAYSGLKACPGNPRLLLCAHALCLRSGQLTSALSLSLDLLHRHPADWRGFKLACEDLSMLKLFYPAQRIAKDGLIRHSPNLQLLICAWDIASALQNTNDLRLYSGLMIDSFASDQLAHSYMIKTHLILDEYESAICCFRKALASLKDANNLLEHYGILAKQQLRPRIRNLPILKTDWPVASAEYNATKPEQASFNGAFVPKGIQCAFNESGDVIPASTLLRGFNLSEHPYVDLSKSNIDPYRPVAGSCLQLPRATIIRYMGGDHWGHYLLEHIASTYFVQDIDCVDLYFIVWGDNLKRRRAARQKFQQWVRDSLVGMNSKVDPSRILFATDLVAINLQVDELLLFSPSACIRSFLELRHLTYVKQELDRRFNLIGSSSMPGPWGEKIYLSRSRLNHVKRIITNEHILEEVLKADGWTIFHPQEHSVQEQLCAYGHARILAGCVGSAFHTLMYFGTSASDVLLALLCEKQELHINYSMQFSLQGLSCHTARCLERSSSLAQPGLTALTIDIATAKEFLSKTVAST